MRRLILVTILAALPALADTKGYTVFCESHLNGLNFEIEPALRFLKKLQVELDDQKSGFPADRYARIGAGRAAGPLVAALKTLGAGADSLPVELNFHAPFIPGSLGERQLHKLFDTYLPLQEMESKTLGLIIYDEDPRAAIALVKMIENFLSSRALKNQGVRVEFFTRQDEHELIEAEFANSLTDGQYRVRPMAVANELRHWLHDGLLAGQSDFSQYKIVDVQSQARKELTQKSQVRRHFLDLQEDLKRF